MAAIQNPMQRCNAVLRAYGARYRLREHRRSPWITVYQLNPGGKTREHTCRGFAAADPEAIEKLQDLLIEATKAGTAAMLPGGREDLSSSPSRNPCWPEICAAVVAFQRGQGVNMNLLLAFDGDGAGQKATERLLEQLLPQLITGTLSASVLQLPEGDDADGLLRRAGPEALQALIAAAQHWLEWRLARLTAPLAAGVGPAPLDVQAAVEQAGRALVEQLPEGLLRRSAKLQLQGALGLGTGEASVQGDDSTLGTRTPWPPSPARSPRQRAERRVVRLFVHAPECRELLLALELQYPACRAALDWASQLAVVAAEAQLPAVAARVCANCPGEAAAVLAQAAMPGEEVVALLRRKPLAELQVLLDLLESPQPVQHWGSL